MKDIRWRARRWWYRRMAWKNDPSLFMDMHPRIAAWVYEHNPADLVTAWISDIHDAARHKQIEVAMRRVGFVEPNGECRIHKWSCPEEVYALAKEYGWHE